MSFFKRTPSASDRFAAALPPSPLNAHLASLHALLLHLGAEGDALAIGEHSLRLIATFTRDDPYRTHPALRPRRDGADDE